MSIWGSEMLEYAHFSHYQSNMVINVRHTEILQLMDPQQEVQVQGLAEQLDISESTVRRDLARMAEQGLVVRTHGGAILKTSTLQESSFHTKHRTCIEEKRQIAKKVSLDILSGSTCFIDSGTTCLEAARQLLQREDCRLVTNSLPVLIESCQYSTPVMALGGEVRAISQALVGGEALSALECLRVDVALIGASGLDENEGIFTTEFLEATVKKTAIQQSRMAWLLADKTKNVHCASLRFAAWSDLDSWYHEDGIETELGPCS